MKTKKIKIAVIAVLLVVAVSIGAFAYLTRPVVAPSTDIESATPSLPGAAIQGGAVITIYRISQNASKAEFAVDEILRSSPNTAVGTTNQVAGDIQINMTDPSKSTVGTIRVNARTFKTDSSQRDGAIGRFILKSEDAANEFIDFEPTALNGMPAKITEGTPFNFEITGDLTIAGVTKPTTFHGEATVGSEGQLSVTATTTVKRSDYNLPIPNVPFVASVEDNVFLTISITANAIPSGIN